jgi:hypothetical protein
LISMYQLLVYEEFITMLSEDSAYAVTIK